VIEGITDLLWAFVIAATMLLVGYVLNQALVPIIGTLFGLAWS
jgi:hypothetical protein